jgi:hypothetical protein
VEEACESIWSIWAISQSCFITTAQEILRVDENNGGPAQVGFLEADLATIYMNLGNIDKAVDLPEVRVRLVIKQATNRMVLKTPTGTFEATIMLEAVVELEERYMKVDFTSLSDTQSKLFDVYRRASDFDKLSWHLENVLNERIKSLSGAAKGPSWRTGFMPGKTI